MKNFLVIGNPIDHSLSPNLHNYWIKLYNIDAVYEKRKLDESGLEKLILEIKKEKISGINITVPFKKAIIPFLDKLTAESKKTQSVNTIYLEEGKITGHNTDIEGFENSMKKSKFDINKKKIFILGAGGVVPSIIFALNKMGVSEVIISNRSKEKAQKLKDMFGNLRIINWGEIPDFDMIINATSLGLKKTDKINLDLSAVGKNKLFYDVIYNPKETNFLKDGKKTGNAILNGKLMFVHQALAAFNIWHGLKPEINDDVIKLLD